MKAKQHRLTKRQALDLKDLVDLRESLHGVQARDYLTRYILLKEQAVKLKKMGLKVRIALPDFPRRPLLIIEK